MRRIPEEQRWNTQNTLDGEESRNGIVRFRAPVEGPATEPADPPPEPNLLVPRVRFGEKRSAENAVLQERDEQAKAMCNVCEDLMGAEIECDYEYTETDPISPAELAAESRNQQDAYVPRVTSAECPSPRSASHHPRVTR